MKTSGIDLLGARHDAGECRLKRLPAILEQESRVDKRASDEEGARAARKAGACAGLTTYELPSARNERQFPQQGSGQRVIGVFKAVCVILHPLMGKRAGECRLDFSKVCLARRNDAQIMVDR